MTITLDGTTGITTPTYGGAVTAEYSVPVTSFKNRIINGAMVIDQRNAGASVTPTTNVTYTLDRWCMTLSQSSKFSVQQQSSVVPTGFNYAMKFTSLSAYTVGAEVFGFRQMIEGFNFADMGWGTANAKTVTLSFQVYSSLTGTFGGAFLNSAENRSYPFTYTISSANTWTSISVTVAGDTSGTWIGATNGVGLELHFGLGVGSSLSGTAGAWASASYFSATGATSLLATNGATFYITGVQLEKGSTATSFDYRPYGTELALCQRYYQKSFPVGTAPAQNAGGTGALYCESQAANGPAYGQVIYPVQMRATPTTFTAYNPSNTNGSWRNLTASSDINSQLYSSSATGFFLTSNTQAMNQYAIAAIHWSVDSEL